MGKQTFVLGLSLLLAPAFLWAAGSQDYREAGMALFRAGQYAKALGYFQDAVQADPNDAEAYEDMGDTYAKMGDTQNARDAYQKSLQINPNNSNAQVSLDNLGGASPSNPPAQDNGGTSQTAPVQNRVEEDQPIQNPRPNPAPRPGRFERRPAPVNYNDGLAPMDHAKTWIKLEGAYNYSMQPDLIASAKALNSFITGYGATGSAVADRNGGLVGAEWGFLINPNNGLAIGLRGIRTNDYLNNENLQNGPAPVTTNGSPVTYDSDFENETISPYVYPLTLDYYLFLPDGGGRFFISAGAGYYFGLVHVEDNYSYVISSGDPTFNDNFAGDLTSSGVGFQAGVGRDFAVGRNFGISLFARGRYARLTNFRGTVYNPDTGGSANDGLAVFSDGSVHSTDVSNIGNSGVNYATIDFTGFDVGLAFTFYAN